MCALFWYLSVFTVLLPKCVALTYPNASYDTEEPAKRMVMVPTTTESTIMSWTPGKEIGRTYLDGELTVFRVVNGKEGFLGDVPYQIAFRKQAVGHSMFQTFCGGTLISKTHILSAAHCFHRNSIWDACFEHTGFANDKAISLVWAVAATKHNHAYRDAEEEKNSQWRQLKRVRYPPTFYFPTHDIALVTVWSPFVLNKYVSYVPHARRFRDYQGTCLLSGFGRISPNQISRILRLANLRVLTSRSCDRLHGVNMRRFVCTSDQISDIGKGDSGGPLVCKKTGDPQENNKGLLVGVVSGRKIAGQGAGSSFFTRVSSFLKFIDSAKAGCDRAAYSNCVFLAVLSTYVF